MSPLSSPKNSTLTKKSSKMDFANKMTAFLASNRVKNALSGGNGVYNQDKFHMIFDELQKRKIKENEEPTLTN